MTAFIPVSLTRDSIPHALRTLNATPVYQLLTAVGIYSFFKYLKPQNTIAFYFLIAIVFFVFLFQFVKYQIYFYKEYPILYSRDWQYGNKQVVGFIKENYDKYDLIVFTREYGEPHMFTLFYLNYPPERFQNDKNLVRFETYDWVRVLKFDKFYFPDLGDEGTRLTMLEKSFLIKRYCLLPPLMKLRKMQLFSIRWIFLMVAELLMFLNELVVLIVYIICKSNGKNF